jgi:hypothetical protein
VYTFWFRKKRNVQATSYEQANRGQAIKKEQYFCEAKFGVVLE